MKTKICTKCQIEKELVDENFRLRKYRNGREYFMGNCRDCERGAAREYSANHREERKEYAKNFYKSNPEYKKQWRVENKERLNKEDRKKRSNDICFRLRKNVSRSVSRMIEKNCAVKKHSILKFLPYTIEELKQHIESLFEPWMNWENHGHYQSKSWKDDDVSTWTWQIDHIIPQSELQYDSMEHSNFQKCWALNNLRPYSAKQNIIDGSQRIRHKR